VTPLAVRGAALRAALDRLDEVEPSLQAATDAIAASLRSGGKVLVAGNGGSAAEAQHLTAELIGRLDSARERPGLAAVALHADSSTLTALGNDYGYEEVFARQVEALGREGDVLVVLSTSGASRNLVGAVDVANARGVVTIGLLGGGAVRPLHDKCSFVLAAPTDDPQTVQECHLVLVHALVAQLEDALDLVGE
jgi:D-sedoheptulose 7-phosphate isomerase